MTIFRKPRRTEVLLWSVIFPIGTPAYIILREAIRPLAVSQLGTLGVSLLLAVVPVAVFAWIFKGAPTGLCVVLTLVCYLVGAWCAFNTAAVFKKDT